MEPELVAEKVPVLVGTETRVVDIYLNEQGSLEFRGLGSVIYEMLGEELSFAPVSRDY